MKFIANNKVSDFPKNELRPFKMGFFLPSETARLVLSYLLDRKFHNTATQFMGECPHIQVGVSRRSERVHYFLSGT